MYRNSYNVYIHDRCFYLISPRSRTIQFIVCVCMFQEADEISPIQIVLYIESILLPWYTVASTNMKVSPLLPQTSVKKQEDVPLHDDSEAAANNCLKRRRLHSQTNIIINGHYRHSKHHYSRHDDKSSSMDCFDAISNSVNSNSSCNSSNSGEEASDCDDTPTRPQSRPNQQYSEGRAPSPAHTHNKKVRSIYYSLRHNII